MFWHISFWSKRWTAVSKYIEHNQGEQRFQTTLLLMSRWDNFSGGCPEPGGLLSSTRTKYNGPYHTGAEVTYECHNGNTMTIACGNTGNWSQKPSCRGKDCFLLQKVTNKCDEETDCGSNPCWSAPRKGLRKIHHKRNHKKILSGNREICSIKPDRIHKSFTRGVRKPRQKKRFCLRFCLLKHVSDFHVLNIFYSQQQRRRQISLSTKLQQQQILSLGPAKGRIPLPQEQLLPSWSLWLLSVLLLWCSLFCSEGKEDTFSDFENPAQIPRRPSNSACVQQTEGNDIDWYHVKIKQ